MKQKCDCVLQHVFKDESKFSLAMAWAGKDDDGVRNNLYSLMAKHYTQMQACLG